MMTIGEARDGYYTHSGKASDAARQLSFAAIAVMWIFREGGDTGTTIPADLLAPLVWAVMSLAADFLHYVTAALCWGRYCRTKEKEGVARDEQFAAPAWLNWMGNGFWGIKILFVVVCYSLLLTSLWSRIAGS